MAFNVKNKDYNFIHIYSLVEIASFSFRNCNHSNAHATLWISVNTVYYGYSLVTVA